MASQKANSTLTVTFMTNCESQNANINVELDSVANAETDCFQYGQHAFFKMYTNPIDMHVELFVTAGNLMLTGSHSSLSGNNVNVGILPANLIDEPVPFDTDEEPYEITQFVDEAIVGSDKPIRDIPLAEYRWFGNDWGAITRHSDSQFICSDPSIETEHVAISGVRYTTQFRRAGLTLEAPTNPPDEFPVIVYIIEV